MGNFEILVMSTHFYVAQELYGDMTYKWEVAKPLPKVGKESTGKTHGAIKSKSLVEISCSFFWNLGFFQNVIGRMWKKIYWHLSKQYTST